MLAALCPRVDRRIGPLTVLAANVRTRQLVYVRTWFRFETARRGNGWGCRLDVCLKEFELFMAGGVCVVFHALPLWA